MFPMACWARCSLAAATIFIAEVICNVLLTEAIRVLVSLSDAMAIVR